MNRNFHLDYTLHSRKVGLFGILRLFQLMFGQTILTTSLTLCFLKRKHFFLFIVYCMEKKFEIVFLEEALDFLKSIDSKAREKIIYNISKAQVIKDNRLFKKLTNQVWEFRTHFNRTYYRLLAFWDKSNKQQTTVIITHGIIKKTNRASKRDMEKTTHLMRHYFEQKKYGLEG